MTSNVSVIDFKSFGDDRGQLIALESGLNIPFEIRRVYYLYKTTPDAERGFHAHRNLRQVAVAVSGSCQFDVEHVNGTESYTLDTPDKGLYMAGLVWREIRNFSENCVVMVLADDLYSESDYIRKYENYKNSLDDFKSKASLGD